MQAVEFEADVIDNKIEIPQTFRFLNSHHVKLVALFDEKVKPEDVTAEENPFTSPASVDSISLISRDEIHER